METYARYKYTQDMTAKRVGNGWHKVSKEYMMYYPSGLQCTIIINGVSVKARHCEIVQVFTKQVVTAHDPQIPQLARRARLQKKNVENNKKKLDKQFL